MFSMKGRPPKPNEVKRAMGNPGGRPLDDPITIGGRDDVVAPGWLDPVARAVWDSLATEMQAAGVLDTVDVEMMAQFCVACAVARKAATQMNDNVAATGARGAVKDPAITAWKDAVAVQRQLAEQFGLTPSARARLGMAGVQGAAVEDDPHIPSTPAQLKRIDGGKA